MKRLANTIIFALLLSAIPARIWAQDYMSNHSQTGIESLDANMTQKAQIRDYENGFLFNVFEIENVEERVQLASALATSDIWICNPTENPGELYIRPNSYHTDIPIYAEFDYLRMTLREEYEEASLLPKEEFAEVFNSWAHNISNEYYNFLISDHLDRANHCMDAEPFCTSDVYNFPALNSGYSWSGPNYGCLGSSPTNKHSFWYYMRIGVAGNITILIEASFDVDFALWGPFNDQIEPCPTSAGEAGMLTATCNDCPNNTSSSSNYPYGNLHDCSFDARHFEYAHVVNGQVGQYYILLITNYSGSDGYITFQKYDGDGETDCGIMPGIASNDGPYCAGETINLSVNSQAGATYSWTGPNNFTSTMQNPTIPNCTYEMGGTYTCVTTVDNQTTTGSTEVVVFAEPVANFDFTTVCQGNPTTFTSTATTIPAGHEITAYQWDFGDGETADTQNATHTYTAPGTYQVTHTIHTGRRCIDEITQTVTVLAMPVATATVNPSSVQYGGVATLTADPGAEGSFSYHWEPSNMVISPNSQTTQTVPIQGTQVFTCTVTNTEGDCTSTAQVTVVMAGSDLTATATADQYEICENGSTILHAVPVAGTGNYTYHWWDHPELLNSTTIQNPVASPPVGTTTFHCTVSDGLTDQEVSVQIIVYPNLEKQLYDTICFNDSYYFYGQHLTVADTYYHHLETQHGCDSLLCLHLATYPEESSEFTVPNNESCDSYFWNPKGHEILWTDHEGNDYNVSGTYQRKYADRNGCDSLVTMHVNLHYSPVPSEIYPTDTSNHAPHWVVTATEFQINSYEFSLYDHNHLNTEPWDSVSWVFETPGVEWILERDTVPFLGKKCTMYVLNHIDDTIWLRATPYNGCDKIGEKPQRYWFVCSFYGIDEDGPSTNPGAFDLFITPNPNNGVMNILFGEMEGRVEATVYDMRGQMVDRFGLMASPQSRHSYLLKGKKNGIYLFVFNYKGHIITKRVVLTQ